MIDWEGLVMAVLVAAANLILFVFLSSAMAAILLGPQHGPAFIRAAAYLYSRPKSGLEWFGFAVAVATAAVTQWTTVEGIRSYGSYFGPAGVAVLALELVCAFLWILKLAFRYRRV